MLTVMDIHDMNTATINVQTWAPAEILVGGGGACPKKAPHKEKKVAKRPPYIEMFIFKGARAYSCGRPYEQNLNIHKISNFDEHIYKRHTINSMMNVTL